MSIKFPHTKKNKNTDEIKALATRENLEFLIGYLKIIIGYDVIKKRPIIHGVNSLPGEEENTVIAHLKSACGLHGSPDA